MTGYKILEQAQHGTPHSLSRVIVFAAQLPAHSLPCC